MTTAKINPRTMATRSNLHMLGTQAFTLSTSVTSIASYQGRLYYPPINARWRRWWRNLLSCRRKNTSRRDKKTDTGPFSDIRRRAAQTLVEALQRAQESRRGLAADGQAAASPAVVRVSPSSSTISHPWEAA